MQTTTQFGYNSRIERENGASLVGVTTGYHEKRVLITGGLGFIGSNLAIRLVRLGARVTIVDASVPGCGANWFNIDPVAGEVCLLQTDIAEAAGFADVIAASEVIFNLAGEISHIHSMTLPERDARLNAAAQLRFLQECVNHARGVRIVYASTRQIYGAPQYLPVDEMHPIRPVDFNGIHKYASTMYHLLWSRAGALDAAVLCLTNVYGPRMALDLPCQGFLNNFLCRLALGERLEIFGDGRQLRDPLYVDDAVDAFLMAGIAPRLPSRQYNIGGPEVLELREIAEVAARVAGGPAPTYREFPAERQAIDIGSYYSNSERIRRDLGWKPSVPFEEGIGRALEYYRKESVHYLDLANRHPVCRLLEERKSAPQRKLSPLAV